MLMSVISTHYDLSRISVGHYNAVSEEINRNLVAIQHIVEQLSQAAEESELTTRDLADTGHHLKELVMRFRY